MIEVRVRHENDAKAKHLCEVSFDRLGAVIPTLEEWGVEGGSDDMFGQFVYDATGAYFEVIFGAGMASP